MDKYKPLPAYHQARGLWGECQYRRLPTSRVWRAASQFTHQKYELTPIQIRDFLDSKHGKNLAIEILNLDPRPNEEAEFLRAFEAMEDIISQRINIFYNRATKAVKDAINYSALVYNFDHFSALGVSPENVASIKVTDVKRLLCEFRNGAGELLRNSPQMLLPSVRAEWLESICSVAAHSAEFLEKPRHFEPYKRAYLGQFKLRSRDPHSMAASFAPVSTAKNTDTLKTGIATLIHRERNASVMGTRKVPVLADILEELKVSVRGEDVSGLDLRGVNCSGVDFSGTNLSGVNMTAARVEQAIFDKTTIISSSTKLAKIVGALDAKGLAECLEATISSSVLRRNNPQFVRSLNVLLKSIRSHRQHLRITQTDGRGKGLNTTVQLDKQTLRQKSGSDQESPVTKAKESSSSEGRDRRPRYRKIHRPEDPKGHGMFSQPVTARLGAAQTSSHLQEMLQQYLLPSSEGEDADYREIEEVQRLGRERQNLLHARQDAEASQVVGGKIELGNDRIDELVSAEDIRPRISLDGQNDYALMLSGAAKMIREVLTELLSAYPDKGQDIVRECTQIVGRVAKLPKKQSVRSRSAGPAHH